MIELLKSPTPPSLIQGLRQYLRLAIISGAIELDMEEGSKGRVAGVRLVTL